MTKSKAFAFSDFAVVRTPLLPFADYLALAADLPNDDLDAGTAIVRRRLAVLAARPEVREALFIASPSLFERASEWNPERTDARSVKTQHALYKYLSRMAYRCTPFGLFAGVSWGDVAQGSAQSGCELAAPSEYRRHVRLDMSAVAGIVARVMSDPDVRHALEYVANPTLQRFGAQWHYIQPTSVERRGGTLELAFVEHSAVLAAVLDELHARDGRPVAFAELAARIAAVAPDTTASDRAEFIDALATNAILLSTLEPASTGGDPLEQLAQALERLSVQSAELDELRRYVRSATAARVGAGQSATQAAIAEVQRALGDANHRHALQTDLFKPARSLHISSELIADVTSACELLIALSASAPPPLRTFANAFRERYGDASVPLLHALDADAGIPFGATTADDHPLLRDVPLIFAGPKGSLQELTWSRAAQLLLNEFERACREDLDEIVLSEEAMRRLIESRDREPPSSFYVLVTILAPSGSTRARAVIRGAGGPSGANLIGRFCCGDARLTERTRAYLELEERNAGEGTILAEIVHRPTGRIDNVIARPALRRHELAVYGRPSVTARDQVALRDLLVSVTREGEIVLTCCRTGRRVLPRLTSAHNYRRDSVPVYEFLAALQMQAGMISVFQWPSVLRSVSRLPRVVFKNCVLSPQRWNLSAAQLERLRAAPLADAYRTIAQWRAELRWPRFVELADGDNRLLCDLDNPVAVDCLGAEIAARSTAVIQEAYVPHSQDFARGPEGVFCNEVLLPFARAAAPAGARARPSISHTWPPAVHGVGSEWLFLKLYAGSGTLDRILTRHLCAILRELMAEGSADCWFFIRYSDPEHHLRLRLHGVPATLWGSVLGRLRAHLSALTDEGLVWRIEASGYEPEVVRYGGPEAIGIAERMFAADSECALRLLEQEDFLAPDTRWLWSACAAHVFWEDCGFDELALTRVYAESADHLRRGLVNRKAAKIAIDRKFRAARASLEALLSGARPRALQAALDERSRRLRPLAAQLRALAASPAGLTHSLEDVLRSQVHVCLNRLITSMNTPHELVIYELLARLHRSRLARSASNVEAPVLSR